MHQLRLIVYPIIYQGFGTIQTVVGLGISEASTSHDKCRSEIYILPWEWPSCLPRSKPDSLRREHGEQFQVSMWVFPPRRGNFRQPFWGKEVGEKMWRQNIRNTFFFRKCSHFDSFRSFFWQTSNFSAEKTPEDSSFREGFSRSL